MKAGVQRAPRRGARAHAGRGPGRPRYRRRRRPLLPRRPRGRAVRRQQPPRRRDRSPEQHGLRLRIGINLGPVRVVKRHQRARNVIGDGINVAQRVMSFAEPNQILVSRSYYEVVSRLAPEYAQLFQYVGSTATSTCASTRSTRCSSPRRLAARRRGRPTTSRRRRPTPRSMRRLRRSGPAGTMRLSSSGWRWRSRGRSGRWRS